MTRKNKEKLKISYFKISLFVMVFSVLILSIGFSSFSNTLTVGESTARISVEKDIRIKNIEIKKVSHGAEVTYADYNVTNISTGLKLDTSDAYAIYDVTVINLGNKEMGIYDIVGINNGLKYEIVNSEYLSDPEHNYRDYKLKDMLYDDDDPSLNKSGAQTHLLIKVSYANSSVEPQSEPNLVNLTFDFREMCEIFYTNTFRVLATGELPEYVIKGDDLRLSGNIDDTTSLFVYVDGESLIKDLGFRVENNTLIIDEILADVTIGVSEVTTKYGLTISSNWLSHNTAEITLNGKTTSAVYIRLRDGDTYIVNSASLLYKKSYADSPIYVASSSKPVNVYIQYKYLSGTYNLANGAAFTIKYRDATSSCAQVNTAELIANYSTQNFALNETFKNTGLLSKSVSQISSYSAVGNQFNNLKFVISYGKQ